MGNKFKDISVKNHTHYFFWWKYLYMKGLVPIYCIGHVTIKYLKYVKIKSLNPPYLIFSEVNGYFEEIDKIKYLTLVLINESKEIIKKYEELRSKIKYLIISITKNSWLWWKHMKINFNSDGKLLLNKAIVIPRMITVVRAIFQKGHGISYKVT